MTINLTPLEKEVMQLLIEGYNACEILDCLGIDYNDYLKTKSKILKKLKVKRIIQILPHVLANGLFK